MNINITVLKLRMHGEEDDVYVFKGRHTIDDVTPVIKDWVNNYDLNYDDQNETWFKDVYITTFDKLI